MFRIVVATALMTLVCACDAPTTTMEPDTGSAARDGGTVVDGASPSADAGGPSTDGGGPTADAGAAGRFTSHAACAFPVTVTIPLGPVIGSSGVSGAAFLCFDLETGECGLTATPNDVFEPCGPDDEENQELTPVEAVAGFRAIGDTQDLAQTLIALGDFWTLTSVSEGELISSSRASSLPPETRIVAVVEASGRRFEVELMFEPEDPTDLSLTSRQVTFFRFDEI